MENICSLGGDLLEASEKLARKTVFGHQALGERLKYHGA